MMCSVYSYWLNTGYIKDIEKVPSKKLEKEKQKMEV